MRKAIIFHSGFAVEIQSCVLVLYETTSRTT